MRGGLLFSYILFSDTPFNNEVKKEILYSYYILQVTKISFTKKVSKWKFMLCCKNNYNVVNPTHFLNVLDDIILKDKKLNTIFLCLIVLHLSIFL